MRLWIDDIRPAPTGFVWAKTSKEAKVAIMFYERTFSGEDTIVISLDHDAGEFAQDGKDYIEVLNWLETEGIVDTGYFFHIHSMNPYGAQRMRQICEKNGWKIV